MNQKKMLNNSQEKWQGTCKPVDNVLIVDFKTS
jgi:hypothetical protein